jgi:phosphatidylserine/phosphatidylglycerophosphate/cardiolipin synthase-like enzyme
MHFKSFAVDRRLVRDGSANWSLGALRQDNNAHNATDPKDISRFEKAFEAMWQDRRTWSFSEQRVETEARTEVSWSRQAGRRCISR